MHYYDPSNQRRPDVPHSKDPGHPRDLRRSHGRAKQGPEGEQTGVHQGDHRRPHDPRLHRGPWHAHICPFPSYLAFHVLTVCVAAPDLPACSHGAARQSRRALVRARATSHWHRHSTCPSSHPARGPAATTRRPYCRCRRHACTTTTTITITTSSPSSSASFHHVCRDPHGAAPQETEAGAVYGRMISHADPFASSLTHATILLAVLCTRLINALLPLAVVFLLLFSLPVPHVSIYVRCTLRTTTPFCFPKVTSVCACLHLPQDAYISLTMGRGGKVINDRSIRNHRNPYRKGRRLA